MDLVTDGRGIERVETRPRGSTVRLISIGLIVVSVLLLLRHLPLEEAIAALGGRLIDLGPWGPIVFGLIYAAAVVLMIPGSALTLAGGALFGPVLGTVTVSIASNLGAALAFLIARYLARDAVARKIRANPKFEAIDRAIGEEGWKIVALLRLSPAVPFNIQNYLYGLTRIGFWPCVLASWVAMLPGTMLYVYLGHVGRAGLETAAGSGRSRTPAEWAMIAAGLLATVAVTIYISRLTRQAIAKQGELAVGGEQEQRSAPAESPQRASRVGVLLPVAATLLFGATIAMELRPDLRRSLLGVFGGPPPATLREAYENTSEGPTVDHSRFDALLRKHVEEGGWVDYRGLSQDVSELDRYLEQVAAAPFDELGRDEKLALLINAYNAFTLKLILEHYPIDSIKSIPEESRWDAVRWRVGPHTWSLNQIEHQQIRPKFREPRVHFALVCAAIGCPPLRSEAYRARSLNDQLEDQTRYVHSHPRWVQRDGETIGLTPLYQWYAGDFEQVAGSVWSFASGYLREPDQATDREPRIRWLAYDWTLNAIENRMEGERR